MLVDVYGTNQIVFKTDIGEVLPPVFPLPPIAKFVTVYSDFLSAVSFVGGSCPMVVGNGTSTHPSNKGRSKIF